MKIDNVCFAGSFLRRAIGTIGLLACIIFGSGISGAQEKPLTQKDIDIFVAIQPAMSRAVKKALADYSTMSADQKECDSCKAGTPSPYRKELDKLFKKYRITAEDFGSINSRVIALYSLVTTEGVMQQARQKIDEEPKGFWGGLKKSATGLLDSAAKKQQESMAQFTPEEVDLITKNRKKLDSVYEMIENSLSDK